MKIVADPKSSPREVTAASKALISAEAQNASDEQHVDKLDDSRNRILATLARLNASSGFGVVDAVGTRLTDGRDTTQADDAEGQGHQGETR